jgi:hypothetical protein
MGGTNCTKVGWKPGKWASYAAFPRLFGFYLRRQLSDRSWWARMRVRRGANRSRSICTGGPGRKLPSGPVKPPIQSPVNPTFVQFVPPHPATPNQRPVTVAGEGTASAPGPVCARPMGAARHVGRQAVRAFRVLCRKLEDSARVRVFSPLDLARCTRKLARASSDALASNALRPASVRQSTGLRQRTIPPC